MIDGRKVTAQLALEGMRIIKYGIRSDKNLLEIFKGKVGEKPLTDPEIDEYIEWACGAIAELRKWVVVEYGAERYRTDKGVKANANNMINKAQQAAKRAVGDEGNRWKWSSNRPDPEKVVKNEQKYEITCERIAKGVKEPKGLTANVKAGKVMTTDGDCAIPEPHTAASALDHLRVADPAVILQTLVREHGKDAIVEMLSQIK